MLEIIIGLIFVYLLYSLICAALSEIIAWFLTLRAKTLRSGIEKLLNDPQLAQKIYAHPIIQGLTHGQKLPSYIPKEAFASALLDILRKEAGTQGDAIRRLKSALDQLPEENALRRQFYALMDGSVEEIQQVRARVEKWFDDSMDRLSGWYKRRAQVVVLIVAAVVAIVANADSVVIVRSLSRDATLRQALVEAAEKTVQVKPGEVRTEPNVTEAVAQLQAVQEQIDGLLLPVGWTFSQKAMMGDLPDPRRLPSEVKDWASKFLGLLFTVLAISLGAPFWFDMLNKVVNVRLAGRQPMKAPVNESPIPAAPA